VSYDIAVWVGEKPASDEAAVQTYVELVENMDRELSAPDRPASALELVRYADELLEIFPEISTDPGVDNPWADAPLKNNIVGRFFYFAMTYRNAPAALPVIAERASAHGLVCFDPQTGKLLVAD
jgi:hypothetical protein